MDSRDIASPSDSHAGETRIYRPELIPRRGELVAWVLTLMSFAAWVTLTRLGLPVNTGLKFLACFLALAAFTISLANWVDRRTRLSLGSDGINFENGLRQVRMCWDDICSVEVLPSRWGSKVRVLATSAQFDFRTLAEVRLREQVKGRMGFEKGDHILREIILKSGLKPVRGPQEGIQYYSRG